MTAGSLVGHRLAGYTVEEVIGHGGIATVYRALDRVSDRQVAVKVVAPQLALDGRFRRRLVREAMILTALDHPNVIPVYEAGESDGLLYVVMGYVDGRDLQDVLAEGVPEPERTVGILAQVAAALDAAHAEGLVHRDVKPANVVVVSDDGADRAYLSGFGLTADVGEFDGVPVSGARNSGLPRYVPPERLAGLPLTGSSDLYALGCLAYEMLTGAPPFHAQTHLALLRTYGGTGGGLELPPGADAVIGRAMARSAGERHTSCAEFVDELGAVFGAAPAAIPEPRPRRRHGRALRRAALLLTPPLLVVGVLVSGAMMGGDARPGTYPGSSAAPFSFRYPAGWTASTRADLYALASPDEGVFGPLVATPRAGDWSGVGRVLAKDPGKAQALLAAVSVTLTTTGPAADVQGSLESLLPGAAHDETALEPVTAGGLQGVRFGGLVSGTKDTLEYSAYIFAEPDGRAAYMVWFNAIGHRDQSMIDSTMQSLVFQIRR